MRKMSSLLSKKEKRAVVTLLIPMAFTALMNVVGVAFILPFMLVASNPQSIFEHEKLAWLYNILGFTSTHHFLIFLGTVVFIALLLVNSMGALTAWLTVYVVSQIKATASHRLFTLYLHKPYSFFLGCNSASLSRDILQLTPQIIDGVLKAGMQVLSGVLVLASMFGLLLYVKPLLAVLAISIIGGTYLVIYVIVKRRLYVYGRRAAGAEEITYKSINEAFGAIKDVKLSGSEAFFLDSFLESKKIIAKNQAFTQSMQQLPRYALEIAAFGSVLLLVLVMLITQQSIVSAIPLITLFVFAGYRLMPTIQSLFSQITQVRASAAALEILYDTLKDSQRNCEPQNLTETVQKLPLTRELSLVDVGYSYSPGDKKVLSQVDLSVSANTTVGFVGVTGSGKTTLIDLVLGLLTRQEGVISVDGIELSEDNLANWQSNLGYVPQHIYLTDDTITRNIAFGISDDEIDFASVKRAAEMAAIGDFIANELPEKYDTVIGERGVRLSGGQRQRIGIARALYHDPGVLVLDEATSALDGGTESAVMQAIHGMAHQKTILIIAHRLATIAECDQVYLLSDGKIKDVGTCEELSSRNEEFRKMAKLEG